VNIITYLVLIQTILSFEQKKSRKNGHLHEVPPLTELSAIANVGNNKEKGFFFRSNQSAKYSSQKQPLTACIIA